MTRAFYHEWPRSDEYSIAPAPAVDGFAAYITIAWSPGMRRDFRDVRFREPSTLRRNYCWLQSKTDGSTATFGIRLYQNQTRVEAVYSNGAAAAEISIADTFDYGEDFEGGALTGWTITNASGGNSCTTSTDQAASGTHSMKLVQAMLDSSTNIRASHASPLSAAVWEFSFYDDGDTNAFKIARVSSGSSILGGWGVFTGASATKYVYHDSAYSYTASSVDRSNGWHSFKAVRRDKHLLLYIDGTKLVDLIVSGTFDTIIFDGYGANPNYATTYYVDNVRIRKWAATEPTFTKVRSGLNPWFPTVASWISRGIPTAWEDQRLVGYSVSRAIADSLWRMSGTFDGAGTHAIASFPRVTLAEPDANGIERPLWHGVVPEFGFTHADAADETSFVGYDYGYFLSTRPLPLSMTLLPAATDPGTFLKTYFDDDDEWGGPLVPFDTSNIHAVTGWGSTITARDIALSESSSVLQACERIADEIGWIFYVGWIDVGAMPSYNHHDPTLRILRLLADEFDEGGEGVAYHDADPEHPLGGYQPRTEEGVDLTATPDGTGWLIWGFGDGTEWVQWTVPIAVTGTWTARFRAVTGVASGGPYSYAVYVDGVKAADVPVPTLSPKAPEWDLSNIPWSDDVELALTEGDVVFRIAFDTVPSGIY